MAQERFVTDGAKDLRALLTAERISLTRFCETHDLDRIEVRRVLTGERQRVSVDFAIDIKRATKGKIAIERFAHSPSVRRKLHERRSLARRRAE